MYVLILGRASDVQLDFTMLDPHVRVFLKHDNEVRLAHTECSPCMYFGAALRCGTTYCCTGRGAAALEGGLNLTSCREPSPQHSKSRMCMECSSG